MCVASSAVFTHVSVPGQCVKNDIEKLLEDVAAGNQVAVQEEAFGLQQELADIK